MVENKSERERERERERALRSEKPTSSERRMKKEGREGREAAAGAIPRKLESRNRPPLEVRQGARAVAVVGAFVRFSRTAVVRRNELQFASKASHHRRAPSTWEGGRAQRTAQVFLSMHLAIANRRFKRIGVTKLSNARPNCASKFISLT